MKTIRLFRQESCRLLRSRSARLIILLTVLSPLAGLTFYRPATADTMLSLYLANPALAGGTAAGILFGVLTVLELSRTDNTRADVLTDAVISPGSMAAVRLPALLTAALVSLGLTMLVWLPVTRIQTGSVFDAADYILAYLLFTGLPLPLSVLAAASAYHFTRRTDLSLILFAAFAALSLTVWADDWQLCWLNPCVWALSDDFSNFRIFRSVAYMRLTWLAALAGIWALSLLCIRRYGKGLFGSLARSVRRIYRPAVVIVLLGCSVTAYAAQPVVDHSNPDETAMTFWELPLLEEVICSGYTAYLYPDTSSGSLTGSAVYRFHNTSGRSQTVSFGINPGYSVSSVRANGEKVSFSVGDYEENNEAMLDVTLPAEEEVELVVEYGGFPQQSRALSTMQGSLEISREYLCLENATLAPRLLNVTSDSGQIPVTVEITLPDHMTVIPFSTAEAEVVEKHDDGTATWRYETAGSGSGSAGILYAGDYICRDIEAGGITVHFYYGRKHQSVMEEADAEEAVASVINYCTEHYGPLSFAGNVAENGSLKLIQSRVTGGGYATDGASLLDEADFTAASLGDDSKGAIPGEVMIHELVHQWWGLANMFDPAEENGLWSAEGLTVYTTYRIVKDLYGEDYAEKHYVNQWEKTVDDYYLNFYVRNPEYLEALPEKHQLAISNSLTSVRQYSEMPLKILKAEELAGGEEAMDQILSGLFCRELDPAYPYLTYQNFLDACGLTEEDLNLA